MYGLYDFTGALREFPLKTSCGCGLFLKPLPVRGICQNRTHGWKKACFLCQVTRAQHINSGPLSCVVTRSQTLCRPPPHQGLYFCLLTVNSDCSFPFICVKWRLTDVAAELETFLNPPRYAARNCSRECFNCHRAFKASLVRVAFQFPFQPKQTKMMIRHRRTFTFE